MDAMADEYAMLTRKADMKEATARISTFKTAASQLAGAWRAALKELKKASTDYQQAQASRRLTYNGNRAAALRATAA
eukprot:3130257-Alexandrium_andersonii.AAC.1